ncbi:MAG: histidine--tRNA ligase [Deltaproteobacteria bacterium]|nr:histidine--tRNA ligase [Deltaproteobacteria bacterium]
MEFSTIKGFRDILPKEVGNWHYLETTARTIFKLFGFKEIRPPLLERTELFSRSIGQDTDIVSKEMYTLTDSKGRGMTLRPEATASVVRAYIQNRLYQDDPVQKLFTIGPMFRHERPQKGRFRQFHQINAELFGDGGPRSDADLIHMAMHLLTSVGLVGPVLNLNSLGCEKCRDGFRKELKSYLAQRISAFCGDCQKRAETNPLRVFDCKVDTCKEQIMDAPSILDYICEDCREHFSSLQGYLKDLGIPFSINHRLVRGLDYYTRTCFEIQSDQLGAQNAVIGGGRYDGLVKELGGPDHPAIGFAIGVERLLTLLEGIVDHQTGGPDLFIAGIGSRAEEKVFHWTNILRRSGICVEMEYGSKGLKAQMKKADRVGAKKVLIVGDDELASGKGIIRDMGAKIQTDVDLDKLEEEIKRLL